MDSASAQFAASALVTSEQLMGFKMKDDVVLGIGVNGVLPASGEDKDTEMVLLLFVTFIYNKQQSCTFLVTSFFSSRSIQGLTPQ